jgi:hypothetical protein
VPAHDDRFIGLELIELAHALDSVRILADVERAGCLPTASELRQLSRATSATVQLVGDRLRQLGARLAAEGAGTDEAAELSRAGAAAPAAGRRRREATRRDAGAPPARSRVRRRGRPAPRR